MFALAFPVVIAELGWMTMGMVDTLMVGPLGPEAIGAVGLGSAIFIAMGVFGMGMLLGLDTLVSQSFGAGRLDECHRWLVHGVFLSVVLTIPTTVVLFIVSANLDRWGMNPDVLRLMRPYLDAIAWSTLPLLVYFALRRYLQGLGVVRPIMITLIVANLMNLAGNWLLIDGNLGAPALGVAGSAWATVLARITMAGSLFLVIVRRERHRRPGLMDTPLSIEAARLRQLVALGAPAAGQLTLEVGV